MNDLVKHLSEGEHPVEIRLQPEKSVQAFRDCLARGFLHIKFTGTRGGTELGVRLDPGLSQIDAESISGEVRFVGHVRLNYVNVRCVAVIDLQTFQGIGHLELLAAVA